MRLYFKYTYTWGDGSQQYDLYEYEMITGVSRLLKSTDEYSSKWKRGGYKFDEMIKKLKGEWGYWIHPFSDNLWEMLSKLYNAKFNHSFQPAMKVKLIPGKQAFLELI